MRRPQMTFFQWALHRFNEFRRVHSALVWESEPRQSAEEMVWDNVNHSVRVICRTLPGRRNRSREVYIDGVRQENWDLIEHG